MTTRAFAKINVTLRVLGRRTDGLHEVRTVLQTLALHDTLTFLPADGPLTIECSDPDCPADRTNLVYRAAESVWRASGRRGAPRGVSVRIVKRIPLRAGLGGGSSDAAAAIAGLTRFWKVDLGPRARMSVAASLGADVPFFLTGGMALGLGRGDVIFPLADIRATWVVIVVPMFGVSTKDAYGWWDEDELTSKSAFQRVARTFRSARLAGLKACTTHDFETHSIPPEELTNDLQGPVTRRHPEIGRITRALTRDAADYAAMSGSGSAVFAFFASRAAAAAAAGAFRSSSHRILVTKTVDRRAYARLAAVRSLGR